MKQTFKLLLFTLALQLWSATGFCLNDGDEFTALVPLNGDSTVEMTFSVVSEIEKTARVGIKQNKGRRPCIKTSTIGKIVIPSKIGEYSIVTIGAYAFSSCKYVTSIEVPYGVKNFSEYAFTDCIGLTSIVIPNSVSIIAQGAISGCTGLTSINIPNSVTSIRYSAFEGCTGLTSINIPNSVTSIGYSAFSGCTGLTSINIPNSVTSIGYNAFAYCTSLNSIEIPYSMTTIESGTFKGCSSLSSVEIPNSITTIGTISSEFPSDYGIASGEYDSGCFSKCSNLTSIVIPNSVTSIGDGTFSGCNNLKSIVIPNSVTMIGGGAFMECNGLESIFIPDGVKKIRRLTFFGCRKLASIEIPNSVTGINSYAFSGCPFNSLIIPNGVTYISNAAFSNCKHLKTLTLGKKVLECELGSQYVPSAFDKCDSLEKIVFHCNIIGRLYNNDSRYNNYMIYNRKNIKEIIIGEEVTSIRDDAFSDYNNLTSIIVEEGNPYYDSRNNCNALIHTNSNKLLKGCQKTIIPNSVTTLSNKAFYNCKSLTSIAIPNSVVSIEKDAFFGCGGLTSIVVENGNPNYDSRENCNAIIKTDSCRLIRGCHNTIIPQSVQTIASYSFNECYDLTSITIPTGVSCIEDDAFSGCYDLSSLTIPESITNMGEWAFNYCRLQSIICYLQKPFPYTFRTNFSSKIYDYATLYVPANLMELYRNTEGWKAFKDIRPIGEMMSIQVKDDNNEDITNKVNIIWYNHEGKIIGTGSNLGGIENGAKLFYSIILNENIGRLYREVIMQPITYSQETITCQLHRIEEVTIHGKVSAYGTALPRVEVNVTQWLNGKYEYDVSTLTDANGEFSLDTYNDSTELIVIVNGYIDNKIVCENLNAGGEFGDIEMEEVKGKIVVLNLDYQEATKEGNEPIIQNWYRDTRNIDYCVYNLTKGKEINDFAIQQCNIVLPTGVDNGDRIKITVRSLNEKFAEASNECILTDRDSVEVSLHLLALGGIEANYLQASDESLLVMLYDSTGQFVMRTICSTSRLTITDLTSGAYTMVTMGYNGAVGSVANISDFTALDLHERIDYVRNDVIVRDGFIVSVNVPSVPELDASKFEYVGENSSYLPNKMQLVIGDYITMTARLVFKERYEGKVSDIKVVVDIPDGCEFVPNSVVIGTLSVPHVLNGNRLYIMVDEKDLDQRIRFCIVPTQTGTYVTTACAEFEYKGSKIQPIGQIQFEATSGELYIPTTTRTPMITIGGIGVPKADVEVYDDESLIGTTTTLANGKWNLKCELMNPYNLSTHNIYVKYRLLKNIVGKTKSKECLYDINDVTLKKVTMLNIAHPAGSLTPTLYESVWDFENIDAGKDYYSYWPNYPNFTFLIDLTENDITKVSNVVLSVKTTDGDVRKLRANYDGKRGCFVATSTFDSYSTPVNVSVKKNSLNYYNVTEPLYQKDALNQIYGNFNLTVLEQYGNSVFYKLSSRSQNYSSLCLYFQLAKDDEYRLDQINSSLAFEEMSNINSPNRYFISENGATQIVSHNNDSIFVFAVYDYSDIESSYNLWNSLCNSFANVNRIKSSKRVFIYDVSADSIPQSTDALNRWRDNMIIDAINAANKRLPCADDIGKIEIHSAIKDLRQCVGFSIGSFLAYTTNLGISAAGRPGNAIEGAYQAWETTEATMGFGEGIDGLSRRGRESINKIYSYPVCSNDDDDDDDDDDDWHPRPKTRKDDPSGYVYEAVPTNRIEGVTATIYYDEDDNVPVQWEAEEYGEINPQITDESGLYAWDVPQGMWQVRFEKDGYETQQTDWLPVPPPQLEINIPMQQAIAPVVSKARGAESGIWLTFSKYMKPETLTKSGRVSATCNGKTVRGEVEMLDLEEDPYNKYEYASKVKFVPDVAFNTTDEVIITVKKEVESYASMPMEADFVQRVTIEPEIKEIGCDSLIVVDYQNAKTVEIAVTPASAAKGKTLHVESTSPMIVSVDRSEVKLNDEGKAYLTVSGNLPGGAALLLSLPEAELTTAPQVLVVIHENVVHKPKASKRTGSIVEEGFLLTLTCTTPGATIYYTTDGSCPCDEQARQRYDGPIVIDKDMTINAIAVREGMDDSEVATFTYKVGDPSDIGITEVGQVSIEYDNGAFVIKGAEGSTCDVYDLSGQLMTSKRQLGRQERIVFHKKGVYVVNVETAYGVTYAKKMVAR